MTQEVEIRMRNEYQKIWEAWQPEFTSKEREQLAGVDKHMPTSDVKVDDNPYASMSDLELQDQLEAIQIEIEKRRKSRHIPEVDF